MLAEPPSQDKEALRTQSELSTAELPAPIPSRITKILPYFIPVALYQIFSGFLFSFAFPSPFHICLTFIGFISLSLLGLALHWFKEKENSADAHSTSTDQTQNKSVLITMLVCAFLKLSTTPLVLSNISFQKEYMTNYRAALNADWSPQSQMTEIYEYMIVVYAWADLALLVYSLPLVLGIFRSTQRTGKIYTSFNFIFNTIMLGLALTLIFKTLALRDLEVDSPSLSSNLTGLLVVAGLCAGLSLSVWIVNARKWRIGFFTLSIVMILLSLTLGYLSSSISSYADEVYDSYSDTRDLKEWRLGMMSVSKEEIEGYGCPAKYITSNRCEKQLIIRPTEIPSYDASQQYCLNLKCAGLLGQYYAAKYFQIANWGLTTAVNMTILAFSLLYYSLKRREQISSKRITKSYKWLILLGVVGLTCYLSELTSQSKPIESSTTGNQIGIMAAFDEDTLLETTKAYSFRPDSPGYLNVSGAPIGGFPVIAPPFGNLIVRDVSAFVGIDSPFIFAEVFEAFGATGNNGSNSTNSTLNVDANVTTMLNDMLGNQTYNYIVLGYNQTSNQVEVFDQGKAGNTSDTLTKINDTNPKIAILNLPGDSTTNNFVIIVYVPDSAAQNDKDIYNNFIIPQASALTNNLSIPVLTTNNSQDLQLANVQKYAFKWPRTDTTAQVKKQLPALIQEGLLKTSQKNISSVVFRLKGHYIDTNVEKAVNEAVVGREYRYVLLEWDPSNLLKVKKQAPKNASYDELLTDLVPGKSLVALVDFEFKDKNVPILISWSPESIYTQQWQTEVYELILNEVSNLNIPYTETSDITSLSQANLTDFLESFWSQQVESYSKYNSKELLSIFPNIGDQQNPENLFGPFYEDKNESLITDMLLRRTYRYVIFNENEQNGGTKLIFNKTAPKEASLVNFLDDLKGNGNQLALVYLDFLNLDKIVCLAITDQRSLEKNYLNYAKIAAAAEVYDIPMAYVTSADKIDIEQLTLFTFVPEILHILDELKIDPAIQDYWKQFSAGTKNGYITFILQDNYSQVKLLKAAEGVNVTYQNFQNELTDKQALYAILNIANSTQSTGGNVNIPSKPYFVTWIPKNADLPSKILYKQAEVLLFPLLPGSKDQKKNVQPTEIISLLY